MSTDGAETALVWRDPIEAFAPLADDPYALLLLSGAGGGVSVIAAHPIEAFEGDGLAPLLQARRALADRRTRARSADAFAHGVMAGLLTYEFGAALLPVARMHDSPWPDVALGLYDAVAVFDHRSRRLTVRGAAQARARLAARLGAGSPPVPSSGAAQVRAAWSRQAVEEAVARAVGYIRAGDIYQANISLAFAATLGDGDHPYNVFRRLTHASPAPFAAFFRMSADKCVATHSPERFVRVSRDGEVQSRPIKGTRPRGRNRDDDARLQGALRASAKDRAENLMIVDLVRNDLARVCAPGTVRAPSLFALESYAQVHHLTSTVTGHLAPGRDAFDLLHAAFPAGSVTGAPKIRAMEIIAELEGEPRGPYCGSIGYLDASGGADFNVMIRSIAFVQANGGWRAHFRAGAGIVADSDPDAEYEEMLTKASALSAALSAGRADR